MASEVIYCVARYEEWEPAYRWHHSTNLKRVWTEYKRELESVGETTAIIVIEKYVDQELVGLVVRHVG